MIVISISSVPPKLRGFLTKYLWEISTGVYVGNVNPRIRDALWKRILDNRGVDGRAIMVFSADNEQGFDFVTAGIGRTPVDYEGLKLILNPSSASLEGQQKTQLSVNSALDDEYVVLDFETTGLHSESDFILEIGALLIKNGVPQQELNRLVRVNVPDEITNLTGITQEMANNGVAAKEALQELADFIGGRTVIGYNIRMFDARILNCECKRHGIKFPLRKVIDVMELVKRKNLDIPSYKMKDVAKYMEIEVEQLHRALPDCRVCDKIYKWILAR